MAEISIVSLMEVNTVKRWDAEAFRPFLREMDVSFIKFPRLHRLATVTHPSEIPRIYSTESDGKPFLLAQNIRPILPDMSNTFYMSPKTYNSIPLNRLQTDDVLVTRSGVNSGVSSVYLGKNNETYTSGEGLIVRSLGNIKGAYLAVFFSTTYGLQLCKRAIYGSGQPHISPKYLEQTPIPRLGKVEEQVANLVIEAYKIIKKTRHYYPEAEAELLDRLGWENLTKNPVELFYIENFTETEKCGRIDAEHFHPQYKRLLTHLQKSGAKQLSEFCPIPNRGVQPEYVESGEVIIINSKHLGPTNINIANTERTSDTFYNSSIAGKSRLQQYDVLVYSTGAYVGRTNVYLGNHKAIANNHVTIIRPDKKICNPVFLSLFLNSIAGIMQSEQHASGSAQRELYPNDLMRFLIYLPTNKSGEIDLEWQEKLTNKVIQASKAIDEAQEKIDEAKRLVEKSVALLLGRS